MEGQNKRNIGKNVWCKPRDTRCLLKQHHILYWRIFLLGWNLPRLHLNIVCIVSIKTHKNVVTIGQGNRKICHKSEV